MNDESLYDSNGYDLRAVQFFDLAHEGARVRALASRAADGFFADVYRTHPRSITVVCHDYVLAAAARLAFHTTTPWECPVMIAGSCPSFAGPLDIVLVCGTEDSTQLIEAARQAAAHGATTYILAPTDTLLAAEPPTHAKVIEALPTTQMVSVTATAVLVSTIMISLIEEPSLVATRLNQWADRFDDELARVSPDKDPEVNPALELYRNLVAKPVIHTASTQTGLAVAAIAHLLSLRAGLPSSLSDPATLAHAETHFPSVEDDIFHDPFLDDAPTAPRPRIVTWGEDPNAQRPGALAVTLDNHPITRLDEALRLVIRLAAATIVGPHYQT